MKRTAIITLIALLFVSIVGNVPNVAATSGWHINAGGADYTDGSGTLFVADKLYVTGDFGATQARTYSFTDEIVGTDDDALYQTLRGRLNFSYLFDIPNDDYDVTLYFMDPWATTSGYRIFDVSLEGTVVLDNLDIYDVSGGQFHAYSQTFTTTVSDGQLNVDIDRVLRTAIISAISVTSTTPAVPEPEITVSPTSIDFNDVTEGTSSDLTVNIANDGTADLNVSSLTTTNALFTVESPGTPLVIAAGNNADVTVRFSPIAAGAQSGTLNVVSDDADEGTVPVSLDGNGVTPPPNDPDINVTPTSIDFGNVTTGSSDDQTFTIENNGTQDLNVTAVSSTNGTFTVSGIAPPVTITPGNSHVVTVTFSPAADGVQSGSIDITSDDPDEALVSVAVDGEGTSVAAVAYRINSGGGDYTTVGGDLFVADKAYTAGDFGYSGNIRSFTFTNPVANTDDDPLYQDMNFNVNMSYLFDLDNGDYDVTMYFMEPFQSAAGERLMDISAEGVVVFDDYDVYAVAGGQYTAVAETIQVTVSDGQLNLTFARELRAATIAAIEVVSAGGVTPPTDQDISVSPLSVDYGQVTVGSNADQIVTVTNAGGMDLTVSSMSTTNGVFTIESPGTPFTVTPGNSEPVTVRYTPSAVTIETGDLTINSDDPDEAVVTISLSGEGTTIATATTYTDVTSAAGVSNSHVISAGLCPPDDNPPIGNGAAWADYDGDGDVDVYVTNQSGANWLYSNDGDGTFTDMASTAGVALAGSVNFGTTFIDHDNDGDQDLWVGGHGGNSFFDNNGNGTFSDISASSGLTDGGRAMTAGWADFNEDGYLDVYLAKHKYCAGDDRQEDKLFVNNGDGTFTDVTTDYLCDGVAQCNDVMGLAFVPGWLDYDNDGDLDIFLVNDDIGGVYQPTKLFRNDGSDGTGGWNFVEVAASVGAQYSLNGMGLGVGDYNNDGHLDMSFSNMTDAVLLTNDGDGTFTDDSNTTIIASTTSSSTTWGTAFFDHDNDGWLDLYMVNGSLGVGASTPNYLFGNNGDGSFSNLSVDTNLNDGGRARGLAIADFNEDGFMDVLVLNYGQTPALLQNDGNSNNWLSVTVEGSESNRDGIGTRVILVSGGETQIREISSGASHGGGDQRVALFGMDGETSGTLTIQWPNGEVESLGTVSSGQQLHFVEPPSNPGGGTTYVDVTASVGITAVDTLPVAGCGVPAGVGIAWADYDNDGDVDSYIANHNGDNYLYRNDGDTNFDNLPDFTDVATSAGVALNTAVSMSAVFIDFDNDGDQDLYVTNDAGNSLLENQLIESGSATFNDITVSAGVADTGRAVTSAWADFNNDGYLDFYVAKHMPCTLDNADNLYMNNGDDTFTEVTSYLCGGASSCAAVEGLGFSPAFLDYDNDGDVDLHLVNDDIGGTNYPNVLWRNDGAGCGGWCFTDVSAASGTNVSLNGMGQGVGDYNNDGWLDIAYSNGAPGRLLENNGDGTFTDVSGASNISTIISDITWGTVFFDYDNDGDQDLYYVAGEVAAQTNDVRNFMLDNNNDGTFSNISAASGLDEPGRGRSASIVDIDNDGFVDVMVGNYGGDYVLFHNDGAGQGNNNHWLTLTVEGTDSNRDGIGTRISVTAGGVTQIREINSGPTHGGGDYRAGFFGLGANTSATVEISWPNGVVESLGVVSADQQLHQVEPSAVTEPDIDVVSSADFGDAETGTSRDKLIDITNTGTTTLTLSSMTTNNGVFTVETLTPVNIAAGATSKITVRFSPTSDGVENGDLTINSNDPDEGSVIVALTGTWCNGRYDNLC